jgi:hypothetical protein
MPTFRGIPVVTQPADATTDAFGRLRVSTPKTLFDAKQPVDNLPLLFNDVQASGGGTSSTYTKNRASTTLGVSASTAGRRVRQSKRRINYQPGKSPLIEMTRLLTGVGAGNTFEIALADDRNGLGFMNVDGVTYVFKRSFLTGEAVETLVPQDMWNIDRMDGHGLSGITLDVSKNQIFFVDLQYLGVGRVRYGFNIDGQLYYCHEFNHANTTSGVYMSTPNLPIRSVLTNDGTGGAATLEHICDTYIIEGGEELTGIDRTFGRGITPVTNVVNTWTAALSWRLKSTHFDITTIPQAISIYAPSSASYEWGLFLNPTIGGVDAASWVSLADSAIEYDVSRTVTNVISGGYELLGGYATADTSLTGVIIPTQLIIGSTYAGVADQLVLAVRSVAASPAETFLAKVTIRELI